CDPHPPRPGLASQRPARVIAASARALSGWERHEQRVVAEVSARNNVPVGCDDEPGEEAVVLVQEEATILAEARVERAGRRQPYDQRAEYVLARLDAAGEHHASVGELRDRDDRSLPEVMHDVATTAQARIEVPGAVEPRHEYPRRLVTRHPDHHQTAAAARCDP